MGLLDQILGGLAGGVAQRPSTGPMGGPAMGSMGRAGMPAGVGMNHVIMALLPVVLGMLADRQHGSTRGGPLPGMGGMGGLASHRDGLGGMGGLGGIGGGLGALLELFAQRGYRQHADSWVGTGPNQALSAQELSDVFEPQQISEIAAQAGVSEDEAREGLAQLLPDTVDHLTPAGQLPSQDQVAASIDDYVRQLQR